MKKVILSAVLLSLAISNAKAASSNPWYISAEAGIGVAGKFDSENYDGKRPGNSAVYGVGFGKKIDNMFSIDANLYRFHEFHYSRNLASAAGLRTTQDVSSTLLSFNVNADLPSVHMLTPFVTAGIGAAANDSGHYVQGTTTVYDRVNYDFAWNIGAGVALDTGLPVDLSVTYKYFDLGEVKTEGLANVNGTDSSLDPAKTDLTSHTLLVGFKYQF